jgi:hypothetical protein
MEDSTTEEHYKLTHVGTVCTLYLVAPEERPASAIRKR